MLVVAHLGALDPQAAGVAGNEARAVADHDRVIHPHLRRARQVEPEARVPHDTAAADRHLGLTVGDHRLPRTAYDFDLVEPRIRFITGIERTLVRREAPAHDPQLGAVRDERVGPAADALVVDEPELDVRASGQLDGTARVVDQSVAFHRQPAGVAHPHCGDQQVGGWVGAAVRLVHAVATVDPSAASCTHITSPGASAS